MYAVIDMGPEDRVGMESVSYWPDTIYVARDAEERALIQGDLESRGRMTCAISPEDVFISANLFVDGPSVLLNLVGRSAGRDE